MPMPLPSPPPRLWVRALLLGAGCALLLGAAQAAAPSGANAHVSTGAMITPNFKDADIQQVIEAVELDSSGHFVVGVQWHPERTYTHSAFSRAIFSAFAQAATAWEPRRIEASVAAS